MIVPALPGAVAVTVNAAAPVAAPAVRPPDSVTLHVTSAPALLSGVHVTPETPVPAVAPVAVTPLGSWSFTVALVPDVVPPSFPSPSVYVSVPFVVTVPAAVLLSVRFDPVFTVVLALAQLVVVQLLPGVAGLLPPVASTAA